MSGRRRVAAVAPAVLTSGVAVVAIVASACSSSDGGTNGPTPTATRDQLLDPQTCRTCHPTHVDEWSSSMHAYASDDPVFRAMNARGQRETQGQLGKFCVNCHAPLAVREGKTTDGTNLDQVDAKYKGVGCFFCHTVESVTGAHDDPLTLANDLTMRGEYADPVANTAHKATYSALHDRDKVDSAATCGACHDIVTGHGANIERTFAEWKSSVFAQLGGGDTCGQCHMAESKALEPIANAPGVFARRRHSHLFPAVDLALKPDWPGRDTQEQAVQQLLSTTMQTALCVEPIGPNASVIRVIVDNVGAGHNFPSGSSQDRRLWMEVVATKGGQVVYQSGVVPDGSTPTAVTGDPDMWLLRDCMFDEQSKEVKMFWQAASIESNTLPAQVTFDATDPRFYAGHIVQGFPRDPAKVLPAVPDKVTLRVRLQPMGLDVLDDLVQSGDLDPAVRAAMPTLDVGGPSLEWTMDAATAKYTEQGGGLVACVTATSFNVGTDKTPAVNHTKCGP